MNTIKQKIMYFPHSGVPVIRTGVPAGFKGCEHLAISPTIMVYYDVTHSTPNMSLAKFKHVLSYIQGDAIFVCEDGDIPENILDLLPDILLEDARARLVFRNQFVQNGGIVIDGYQL